MELVPTHRGESYPYIDPTKVNQREKHVFITGASKGTIDPISIYSFH